MRVIALIFCSLAAWAQTSECSIAGHIFDPTRAMIQNATITITHRASGQQRVAAANSEGRYFISGIAPGSYSMSAESPGFKEYTGAVEVEPRAAAIRDVVLGLLPVEQQVTITEKAPALESADESPHQSIRQTLEAHEVRESGARDAGEALVAIDGVAKIRKGGVANDVIIRGFAHDNINVLIDGERIHGACPNGMDPRSFHVDFSEIERIEVTKGAFDIRNQGSLGGSVNIVTKDPEPGLRITPSLAAGSYGFYNPSLVGSYAGEKVWALAGYSFRISEPFRDGSGRRFTEYANYNPHARTGEAFRINTGWLRISAPTASTGRADLTYTHQEGDQALYPYLMMDAVYDNADRLGASWSSPRAGFLTDIRIDGYASRVKHWMTDEQRTSSVGAPLGYGMATFAGSLVVGGKAQARLHGVLAGLETYRRKWDAVNTRRAMGRYVDQHFIPNPVIDLVGGYAEYHRTFGTRLRVTAGTRLDRAAAEARAADTNAALLYAYQRTRSLSTVDLNAAGNVWIGYAVGHIELFAGAGHTTRVPDPVERYMTFERMGSDWAGNPLLRPTRNSEADLGFAWRTSRFSLRPTLFYSALTDYVTVHNQARMAPPPMGANGYARSFANVNASMYGGEMAYSVGWHRSLLLSGGVSFTRGVKDAHPELAITSRDIAEITPLRSHTTLRYGNRRFFSEMTLIAVDAQRKGRSRPARRADARIRCTRRQAGCTHQHN